jgi:hypothetical protein
LESSVCNCSWSNSFLRQKNPQQHHDMLCDSLQDDHRGWEGLKLGVLLWECW